MISMDGMPQAGLFSAVSSAFIVNMGSSLSPNSSDTTNSLLKILINKIDNNTFSAQEAALPVWTGPSSMTVWIQTLGYMSLSASLLAAFGAVLAKQWLGHFKTSRFGKGALHERCHRRQQKFDGLNAWHFSSIISALPILLQLSLLFFGIAIAANIWTQQHTVASVIMATTAFGFIFYIFTVVESLKSPDCPFQTPVSIVGHEVLKRTAAFREMVLKKWEGLSKACGRFLAGLRRFSRWLLQPAKDKVSQSIRRLRTIASPSRFPAALRRQASSVAHDPEVAASSEQPGAAEAIELPALDASGEATMSLEELDLNSPEAHAQAQVYAVQSGAVQWILETTTDTDIITTAARMISEIEWPAEHDVTDVLHRLTVHFDACFDATQMVLPLAQTRAVACFRATSHLVVTRIRDDRIALYPSRSSIQAFTRLRSIGMPSDQDFFTEIWDDRIDLYSDRSIFQKNTKLRSMLSDQDFLIVCCSLSYDSSKLDLTSIKLSDRMWMTHILAYRLQNGIEPEERVFVIRFVVACLDTESPLHLVANCLLLAGQLIGLRIDDTRQLATIDKR
jgi:Family of unknown function (DUF6535)